MNRLFYSLNYSIKLNTVVVYCYCMDMQLIFCVIPDTFINPSLDCFCKLSYKWQFNPTFDPLYLKIMFIIVLHLLDF